MPAMEKNKGNCAYYSSSDVSAFESSILTSFLTSTPKFETAVHFFYSTSQKTFMHQKKRYIELKKRHVKNIQ